MGRGHSLDYKKSPEELNLQGFFVLGVAIFNRRYFYAKTIRVTLVFQLGA